MFDNDIQVVSNEAGEATAVIVPVALWKEIASERETAYLLKSEGMRQRLLAALGRERRAAGRGPREIGLVKSIEFDSEAFEDLTWWAEQDRNQAIRIMRLVRDIQRNHFPASASLSR